MSSGLPGLRMILAKDNSAFLIDSLGFLCLGCSCVFSALLAYDSSSVMPAASSPVTPACCRLAASWCLDCYLVMHACLLFRRLRCHFITMLLNYYCHTWGSIVIAFHMHYVEFQEQFSTINSTWPAVRSARLIRIKICCICYSISIIPAQFSQLAAHPESGTDWRSSSLTREFTLPQSQIACSGWGYLLSGICRVVGLWSLVFCRLRAVHPIQQTRDSARPAAHEQPGSDGAGLGVIYSLIVEMFIEYWWSIAWLVMLLCCYVLIIKYTIASSVGLV